MFSDDFHRRRVLALRTRLDELVVNPSLVPLIDWYVEESLRSLIAEGIRVVG